jgi:hypothetical protein
MLFKLSDNSSDLFKGKNSGFKNNIMDKIKKNNKY